MGKSFPEGPGGVPDLGALGREDPAEGMVPLLGYGPGVYVNDAQPSVQPGGAITINYRFFSAEGASEVLAVTMPPGLFLGLASAVQPIMAESVQAMLRQAKSVGEYMSGAAQMAAPEKRGGPPTSMDEARAAREAAERGE